MNLKKLFSVAAGTLLTVNLLVPVGALGASSYGAEMDEGYAYAYSMGVTTQYPIDNANMFGAINRAEMAKMIANWAEKVLGVKADTSASCNFTDTASVQGDLAPAIIRSCQMGLMGQGITAFRPYDTVTRAEFGTLLSRAIWGDKNDGGTPYYAAHLNALRNDGIMTQISDAEGRLEIRGYVMIMLQRADEIVRGISDDECKDPLIMLACALETADCPAKCSGDGKDPETTENNKPEAKGDLEVSINDVSATIVSIPSTGTVIFNSIDFDSSTDVILYSVKLERTGLSSKSDVSGIWFEKDGVRISSRASVLSDGTANINFNQGYTVKSHEKIDLVVSLATEPGAEIAFRIVDVDSSAKNLTISKKVTSTFRTTKYDVATITLTAKGDPATYKMGEKSSFVLGEFEIANDTATSEDKDIKVQSLVLRNNGTADLSNLKNIVILRDSKEVQKSVVVDGRNLTVILNDTIDSGRKAWYTIQAEVTYVDIDEETYEFNLRRATDVIAVEAKTNFRVTNDNEITMKKYTMKGGKLTLSTDSSFAKTIDAGQGYSDVVIAQGTLNVTEAVSFLKGFGVTGTNLGNFKKLTLEVGGYSYVLDKDNGLGTYLYTDTEIYVSRNATVRLIANISNTATTGATVTIDAIKGSNFRGGADNAEYVSSSATFSSNVEVSGVLNVARVTIKNSRFSLVKTSSASTLNVVATVADEVSLFKGTLSNDQDRAIMVNKVVLTGSASSPFVGWYLDVNLYVDGKAVDNERFSGNAISFNSLGIDLAAGKAVTIEIKASPVTTTADVGAKFSFYVSAEGRMDGNDTATNDVYALDFSIMNEGSATVSANNSNVSAKTAFAENSTVAFAQWSTNVRDESLTLKSILLSGDASGRDASLMKDWYVTYTRGSVSKTVYPLKSVNTTLGDYELTDMNEVLEPGAYVFTVYASLGEATAANSGLKLSEVKLTFDGMVSTNASYTGKIDFNHIVYPAVVSLTNAKSYTNSTDNYFDLKITYPAKENGDNVTITKLTFNGNQNGNVTVTSLDGTTTYGTSTAGVVTLWNPITLTQGSDITVQLIPTAAFSGGTNPNSIELVGVEYDVDTVTVNFTNAYSTVGTAWTTLRSSANLN